MPSMPTKSRNTSSYQAKQNKPKPSPDYELYNSSRWRKYTKHFKTHNRVCYRCNRIVIAVRRGKRRLTGVVDHVIAISSGGSEWDKSNHGLMHDDCHQAKRAEEKAGKVLPWKYNSNNEKIPA